MEKVECRLKIFTGLFNSIHKRVKNKIGKNNVFSECTAKHVKFSVSTSRDSSKTA